MVGGGMERRVRSWDAKVEKAGKSMEEERWSGSAGSCVSGEALTGGFRMLRPPHCGMIQLVLPAVPAIIRGTWEASGM